VTFWYNFREAPDFDELLLLLRLKFKRVGDVSSFFDLPEDEAKDF
jgi:hypothetical protein